MATDNIERQEIEKIYGKISPFELRSRLVSLAQGQLKNTRAFLDAGRGNPNWTAATPREAFFTFGQFAVEECKRIWRNGSLAGMPEMAGIAGRFNNWLREHMDAPGAGLLKKMCDFGAQQGFDPDAWIHELADGVIGDHYPMPDRMLKHCEHAVHSYLVRELCYNQPPQGRFDLFAVEGGTAAMCYIFDSLIANNLLARQDKIAVMTPVFTPYLEIPLLPRYNFRVVEIKANARDASGAHTWQYPEAELKKLGDRSIKAVFTVNPSNPPSVAMCEGSMQKLADIVSNKNPDLMIISDDVYGTFVSGCFHSLMADLPYNTIAVYSFSKYFGVTGWRLGAIALHQNNVFDKLLREQSASLKAELNVRYAGISTDPEKIPFIDRIVADSRQVALNHTAGLSTPQQVMMAFLSVFDIMDKESAYKKITRSICRRRRKLLFRGLGLDLREDPMDAAYYTEFDLMEWACRQYGSKFANYLQKHYKPVDVLLRLAQESSIVLLNGSGFHAPEWSIRISLANLKDEHYLRIGEYLHRILEEYVAEWKAGT